jgi:hypothetical protein
MTCDFYIIDKKWGGTHITLGRATNTSSVKYFGEIKEQLEENSNSKYQFLKKKNAPWNRSEKRSYMKYEERL